MKLMLISAGIILALALVGPLATGSDFLYRGTNYRDAKVTALSGETAVIEYTVSAVTLEKKTAEIPLKSLPFDFRNAQKETIDSLRGRESMLLKGDFEAAKFGALIQAQKPAQALPLTPEASRKLAAIEPILDKLRIRAIVRPRTFWEDYFMADILEIDGEEIYGAVEGKLPTNVASGESLRLNVYPVGNIGGAGREKKFTADRQRAARFWAGLEADSEQR